MSAPKLNELEALLKDRYTKRDRAHNVWIKIDHQSFKLESYLEDANENKKHAEW